MVFYNTLPLYGVVLGMVFLGERLGPAHVVFGGVILAGGLWATMGGLRKVRRASKWVFYPPFFLAYLRLWRIKQYIFIIFFQMIKIIRVTCLLVPCNSRRVCEICGLKRIIPFTLPLFSILFLIIHKLQPVTCHSQREFLEFPYEATPQILPTHRLTFYWLLNTKQKTIQSLVIKPPNDNFSSRAIKKTKKIPDRRLFLDSLLKWC